MGTEQVGFGDHWELHARTDVQTQLIFTCTWRVEKWNGLQGENIPSRILRANPAYWGHPEVIETRPNLVVAVGLDQILDIFTARFLNGGWTSDTYFANWSSYIGVGDSSVAAAAGQTDLQAATNKVRVGMNAGYPTAVSSASTKYQADFGSSVGNFAWQEAALFNASSGGTMWSRVVQNFGTKVSGTVWTLTNTITASSG